MPSARPPPRRFRRQRRHLAADRVGRDTQIISRLQVEPELRAGLDQWPRRSAVSPVMARLPWMICEMRFGGTESCRDHSVGVTFNSFSSSARISPGWIAGRGMVFLSMIVNDLYV